MKAKHSFRRELCQIMQKRHEDGGRKWGRASLTPDQEREIDTAAKEYVTILAQREER